jgi:flagellar biosynthetic protein FlhB
VTVLVQMGTTTLWAIGPILAGLFILALISNLFQVGFLFTTQPLMPKLTKLNPLNGVGRLFSMRSLVQLAINLLKLVVVTWVAYRAVVNRMNDVTLAMDIGGAAQLAMFATVLYEVGMKLALVLLVIAILDYSWQKWRHVRCGGWRAIRSSSSGEGACRWRRRCRKSAARCRRRMWW